MNNDFPRILTLLRKEKGLSQKEVATALCVQQALLSHYENGKRECGLDFLVRAADFYGVTTDYLLGRSAVSNGSVISESEIPESGDTDKSSAAFGGLSASLSRKLLTNSIDMVYIILGKMKNQALTTNVSNILIQAVYRAFRLAYRANPKNDQKLFGLSESYALRSSEAFASVSEAKALEAADTAEENDELPLITTAALENEHQKRGALLLNLVHNSESQLKKINF